MNNLYFLVEGRRTESKVYPKWLSYLLPHFTRVKAFDEVNTNHYFLFSGEGYPSILDHLHDAIDDVNRVDRYTHLALCLDADEFTTAERADEVRQHVAAMGWRLNSCRLEIVVQNRCIETWFLGNRKMLSRAPQGRELVKYVAFYDVGEHDPEAMGIFPGFSTHADFHGSYLREMFAERVGARYSKVSPGPVLEATYLEELIGRVAAHADHLKSLQAFLSFCDRIRASTTPPRKEAVTNPDAGGGSKPPEK